MQKLQLPKVFLRYTVILCLLAWINPPLYADQWDNTHYNTTEGTEFYATFVKNQGSTETDHDNLKLYLQVAALEGANVKVTYLYDGSSKDFKVDPKSQKTIEIELSKAYVDFLQNVAPEKQISKRGIYISSDKLISFITVP